MTDAVVAPIVEGPDFTRQGLNLADGSLGAEVVQVTDEFFGPRDRMLNPEQPVFYPDRYDDHERVAYHYAEISPDGSELSWINGTSRRNGTYQAYTHLVWYRCELVPHRDDKAKHAWEEAHIPTRSKRLGRVTHLLQSAR